MSEAHTEDGYLRIANTLMEAVLRHGFSKIQLLVLFCVIRKTYGWGKKMDEISLSQIAELTGLNQSNISRAINDLTKAKVLLKQQGRHAQAIGINKKFGEWMVLLKQQGVVKTTTRGCQNNNLPIVKTTTTKDTPKDTTKRKGKKKNTTRLSLLETPNGVTESTWQDFIAHRQQIKKPITQLAETRIRNKLEHFLKSGVNLDACINRSISNGWTDIFEPQEVSNGAGSRGGATSRSEMFDRRTAAAYNEGSA